MFCVVACARSRGVLQIPATRLQKQETLPTGKSIQSRAPRAEGPGYRIPRCERALFDLDARDLAARDCGITLSLRSDNCVRMAPSTENPDTLWTQCPRSVAGAPPREIFRGLSVTGPLHSSTVSLSRAYTESPVPHSSRPRQLLAPGGGRAMITHGIRDSDDLRRSVQRMHRRRWREAKAFLAAILSPKTALLWAALFLS